jgi:hypothetical protein
LELDGVATAVDFFTSQTHHVLFVLFYDLVESRGLRVGGCTADAASVVVAVEFGEFSAVDQGSSSVSRSSVGRRGGIHQEDGECGVKGGTRTGGDRNKTVFRELFDQKPDVRTERSSGAASV